MFNVSLYGLHRGSPRNVFIQVRGLVALACDVSPQGLERAVNTGGMRAADDRIDPIFLVPDKRGTPRHSHNDLIGQVYDDGRNISPSKLFIRISRASCVFKMMAQEVGETRCDQG